MEQNCIIIFAAPSGSGKTSIVRELLKRMPELTFSVSACTRPKRENEVHGKDYYFFTPEEFVKKIDEDAFVEWEMVYEGKYYGTLKSEIDRIFATGKNIIFDMDVAGGVNLKNKFGDKAISVFIQVPDLKTLKTRLIKRGSETEETLKTRLDKAVSEMEYAEQFDHVLLNKDFEIAVNEAEKLVRTFLK